MYKVYDWYEGCQLVGEFEDWHEMMQFKKEYIRDTDGECDLDVEYIPSGDELEELETIMIENQDVLKRLKERE